ncbi:amidohydrolase family protein [Billgrantia pellis]|uniref:Amidohydrolase family protein n=1 Tax=Billgrantia pellis TaxID=2606936 RepID=A0A7V7KIB6_9GAMM|nr:amidohydrolase family protein [Halomonas pellis]KAA0012500.1 amidohydrolase family protein [Halomonas pellis]
MTIPDIPAPDPNPRRPIRSLPKNACDCHAHIFGPASRYSYHPDRGYTPPNASVEAYQHMLSVLGFDRAVLVQPSVYGTDNKRLIDGLLQAREQHLDWRGVAVLDPGVTDDEIAHLHALGVRGIRINLLFPGGVDFNAITTLSERIEPWGWHVQCLIDVSDFHDLSGTLDRLPLPKVIDHMGHIPVFKGVNHPGFQHLLNRIDGGDTWVKLSGPNRMTARVRSPYCDVDPFASALISRNADRCVFGTDWPHVKLPNTMPNDGDLVDELLRLVEDDTTLEKILVHNPTQLYGF